LHDAAQQAVAAPGSPPALEAEVQQLRMQLRERDAEVEQLRGEVAALKVGIFLQNVLRAIFGKMWSIWLEALSTELLGLPKEVGEPCTCRLTESAQLKSC
jgi:hypothetical protein